IEPLNALLHRIERCRHAHPLDARSLRHRLQELIELAGPFDEARQLDRRCTGRLGARNLFCRRVNHVVIIQMRKADEHRDERNTGRERQATERAPATALHSCLFLDRHETRTNIGPLDDGLERRQRTESRASALDCCTPRRALGTLLDVLAPLGVERAVAWGKHLFVDWMHTSYRFNLSVQPTEPWVLTHPSRRLHAGRTSRPWAPRPLATRRAVAHGRAPVVISRN